MLTWSGHFKLKKIWKTIDNIHSDDDNSPIAGTQLHIADGHVIELGGIRRPAGPEKGEVVRLVLVIKPALKG